MALGLTLPLFACAPNFRDSPDALRTSPAAPSSQASLGDAKIIADDGYVLPLRIWRPAAGVPIRAVIVALHGFNDYGAEFEAPAAIWQARGIITYAYDQRGFGATKDVGRWPGSDTLVEDFRTALRLVRAAHPGLPVVAVGESMGGAVLLDAVREGAQPDGIVLAAPAVWGRPTMVLTTRLALWFGARLIPDQTFTGRDFAIQVSDNIPMLRRLSRDPLVIKATRVDAMYGIVDLMDAALASGPRDHTPTLLLCGAKDRLIPPDAMEDLAATIPPTHLRIAVYPEGWHMLLRDLDGDLVAGDVAAWILDRAAPLPSGADHDAGPRLATLAR